MKTYTPISPFMMLRGPMITWSPDEESGGGGQTDAGEASDDTQAGGAGEDQVDDDTAAGPAGEETQDAAGGDDSLGGGAGDDKVKTPVRQPWQNKRIDTLTAQKKTIEQERDAARAEAATERNRRAALEALHGAGNDTMAATDTPAGGLTEDDVNRRATAIAEARVLNDKIDVLYDDAVKLDPKFTARLPALREAVGDTLAQRPDFFQALTRVANGAAIMNELTKDLDHFSELLDLDPVNLGVELATMGVKQGGTREVKISRAGGNPPPNVITGSTSAELDTYDPKLPMDEYSKRREKEREERHNRRN